MYLYARDLNKPKYKILIKKRKDAGIKHLNDPNAFIECSNTMDDAYENIEDFNSSRNRKILIAFDDMIADIKANKKYQAIIKELFIRCRKLNISLAFITKFYFSVPKDVSLNSTHYNAKISALSSNNLDKYEYLTDEDLGLKPSTVKQAKFEYSPLGKMFNKRMSKDDKKEGLFKRLENIKDKNEEQLQAIKDQGEKQL